MIISALERQKRRQRVNVYVEDGRFLLAVNLALFQDAGLHSGMELSEAQVEALRREDAHHQAYEAALRLLSYRPRSEREMRQRLARRGIEKPLIGETLARLRRKGYLNDESFARYWTESRQAANPRSQRLIRSELFLKGISSHTADAAVADVDDEDAAYRAASRRLHSFPPDDFEVFQRRLGGFLLRRGFPYAVTRHTIKRCWQETQGEAEPPTEPPTFLDTLSSHSVS
jgi:regulatory protein